jgi:hypothetical protein
MFENLFGSNSAKEFHVIPRLKSFGKKLISARQRAAVRPRPRRGALQVEPLEDRTLMSVTAAFDWSMAPRFGFDQNGNQIQLPYNPTTRDQRMQIQNNPAYVQNIDPSNGNRLGYEVDFDASRSSSDNSPITSYSWLVRGKGIVLDKEAQVNLTTFSGKTPSLHLMEGNYFVELTVTTQDGQTCAECRDITVKDILIVSVGDSAASGEGDPDILGREDPFGHWRTGPMWADSREGKQGEVDYTWTDANGTKVQDGHGATIDRSGRSAAAQAALRIEQADPHTSVTFVDVTVSGDPTDPALSGDNNNPGVIGHDGQLDEVKAIVGNRPIDALIVTTGADDIGFSDIVKRLVETTPINLPWGTQQLDTLSNIETDVTNLADPNHNWHHISLGQLPIVYNELNNAIYDRLGKNLTANNVFLTEYFDPTHDDKGAFVGGALGDILPPLNVTKDAIAFGHDKVEVALNYQVQHAAQLYHWHFVTDIAKAFLTHGINAFKSPWVNTDEDSRVTEGGDDANLRGDSAYDKVAQQLAQSDHGQLYEMVKAWLEITWSGDDIQRTWDRMSTLGTAHPNDEGQQAIASILLNDPNNPDPDASLEPFLTKNAGWNSSDRVLPFLPTGKGGTLTLNPHPHVIVLGSPQMTITQAPDRPGDFQVFLGNELVYEAPDQHQHLTIPGGLFRSFYVHNFNNTGMVVQLNGAPGTNSFTIDGAASAITISPGKGPTTVNIERTAADTTIIAVAGPTIVNVSPTAHDLSNIGGTLTVHGNGSTALAVYDQADSFPATRDTISASELNAEWFGPHGRWSLGWNRLATIDYDHVQSLDVHMSDNGNEADVVSLPGAVTLWGGKGTSTVNVCPTAQNLDALGSLTVYGASKLGVPGSIPIGNTTLNVYDQGNPHFGRDTTRYSIGPGWLRRSSDFVVNGRKRTFETEIDYADLTGLTLFTRQSPNLVSISETGVVGRDCPITIHSGAADTITADINPAREVGDQPMQLTVNAHGGTLTLNTEAGNADDGDNVLLHKTGLTITYHSVVYSDNYLAVDTYYPDPDNIHHSHGKSRMSSSTGHDQATISYQNVTNLTINSAPVDTRFDVQSTAAGTPLTINASTGQEPTDFPKLTHMNGGDTVNTFVVGDKGSIKKVRSQLTLHGSSSDAILLDNSQATAPDVLTIANGKSGDVLVGQAGDQFFAAGGGLDCNGIGSLTVNLSKGANDVVHLSPSTKTAFTINGDASEYKLGFGVELDVIMGGTNDGVPTPGAPGAGTWSFSKSGRQPISFSNVKKTQAQ